MKTNTLTLYLWILSFLAALPLGAVEAVLTDDTNSNAARPAVNFGAGRAMVLRNGQNAYLKFDLSTLPTGAVGAEVTKATLKVWVDRVVKAGTYDVSPVADAWTEGTLKGNALPALGAAEYTGLNLPLTSARKYVTLDVTGLVRDWVDGTLPNHGLAITPSTGSTVFAFLPTKEDVATGHLPELEITLASSVIVPFATTGNSASSGLSVANAGAGAALEGVNTAASGSAAGVIGRVSSTSDGSGVANGASGVLGELPMGAGAFSAAVRGVHHGTGTNGSGVIGFHEGLGSGVRGESASGIGVLGVASAAAGVGVRAAYSGAGAGVALEVNNGAIRVAGTNKPAFTHQATAANKVSTNGTEIDHPLCNGDPDAILLVTPYLGTGNDVHYNNSPVSVYFDTASEKWQIVNEVLGLDPTGSRFFVLVLKQ